MLFLLSFFWVSSSLSPQDARILGTNVGPVRMEQQLEVAVMEPNVDHGLPIMNLGMEVLPGIAFPCQGSHLEEPATMMPKLDYALKELIVAVVSVLPHAQPQQLLQQQLPRQQLLLLHPQQPVQQPQPQPPQPQLQQNNAQPSPGICVSTMQPLLDIPKRVAHHTLVKQFKLASACAPELIFLKDQNAGPTLILQAHAQMGSNVLTMFAQSLQIMLHVLKLE